MSKLIVANWKLNPISERDAVRLARGTDAKNAVICPPFPFLPGVGRALKRAALGAQDVFWERSGAYTGEISAPLLKKLGATYVIIGHSERRHLGETDDDVNRKVLAALVAGLRPIVCVGEPRAVRKRGIAAAKRYVANQLKKSLARIHGTVIIAYEPIWAIGTGVPDTPEASAEMAKFIKQFAVSSGQFAVGKVLYGGSVKPENAKRFLAQRDIDGALVGGASLDVKGFRKIVAAA